jgi:hypothetical protein
VKSDSDVGAFADHTIFPTHVELFRRERCQKYRNLFAQLLIPPYRQTFCGYSATLENSMKNALVLLLCLLALALEAHAASSVDGKWESRLPNPQGGQLVVVFDLNANGSAVAGTITNSNGTAQLHKVFVQDGKLQGDTVNFGIFYPLPFLSNRYGLRELVGLWRNWGSAMNRVTGTVNNDTMTFTQRDWKGDTMQFQAVKVK